jgi:hypothetical protein
MGKILQFKFAKEKEANEFKEKVDSGKGKRKKGDAKGSGKTDVKGGAKGSYGVKTTS